jgi:aminoglycoside phosphotransferase family enzyme
MDDNTELPFSKEEFISRLPVFLPQSNYHGDLTLENILKTKDRFCLIDAVTIEYDSYIFDIAKLRQDLECKWFLRSSSAMLDNKLKNIQTQIFLRYPNANNDYLLILMLLRVYKHAKANTLEQDFLIREITKLWK